MDLPFTQIQLKLQEMKQHHTKIYKSLVYKYHATEIAHYLKSDRKAAKKIREVVENGKMVSGYYMMAPLSNGEKELDVCDWDIVGSELCRTTTMSLQGQAKAAAERRPNGPTLDYMMVEAKGCGDRHCRIIAENREKYPAPEHELWESFGPAVTDDYKKYTEEADTVEDSMMFREECNYHFVNGTNNETDSSNQMMNLSTAASLYVLPAIAETVKRGIVTREQADHILRCVLEAAGKAMFGERYAIKALRDWMGVPNSIGEDGRLLAGLIEVQLQSLVCAYEVEAFNEKECILVIDRSGLEITGTKDVPEAHLAMWYGMAKTLINAQWSCWEEDSPAKKLRIKIAKKIDKFA